MNIIEADVFYSDIILGLVIFYAAYLIRRQSSLLTKAFIFLGSSTFAGAFYHGLYDTTTDLPGDILWTLTMTLYGISSLLFIRFSIPKILSHKSLLFLSGLFFLFTYFVNESFIYGLVLQGVAMIMLGIHTFLTKPNFNYAKWFSTFVCLSIIAVYIQQAMITFDLPYSHNTLFHIIEIPAIIALVCSLKKQA